MKVKVQNVKNSDGSGLIRVTIGRKPLYLTRSEAWDLIDSLYEVLAMRLDKK